MSRTIRLVFASALVSLGVATSVSADPRAASLEAVLVALAESPADHRALAEYDRSRAESEFERAASLRRAARHVVGGKLFEVSATRARRLARAQRLEASARELAVQAARHSALAG
jgi:hypothetical protein